MCFTNLPSNTAFRGFGGPQAMAVIENILESIAQHLGIDAFDVRMRNFYGVGERELSRRTANCSTTIICRRFSPRSAAQSQYRKRREEVARFNDTSRTHVRGLAMTGVKFGISFTTKFLNQGNALVNIYTDGTVQVSTGATEMGQGVNVKIRQLVADEFGLDVDRVVLMPTSTEKNNNTSPTAASASTDLNGAAAVRACRAIKRRLRRFAAARLADAAGRASTASQCAHSVSAMATCSTVGGRMCRFRSASSVPRPAASGVDLGARGFYATPGVDFNRETGPGHAVPLLHARRRRRRGARSTASPASCASRASIC